MEADHEPVSVVEVEMEPEPVNDKFYPMANPLVLEKVFEFLPMGALKDCRLVCRLWYYLTYPELQKLSWITLTHDENFRFGLTNFFKFVEKNYDRPEDVIFRNYRLQYQNMSTASMPKYLTEFFTTYGPLMETLHLKRCCLNKGALGQFISAEKMPKLTHLILDECPFIYDQVEDASEDLVEDNGSSENNIRKVTFQSDKSQWALPFELKHFWTMFPKLTDLCLTDLSEHQTLLILDAAVEHRKKTGKPIELTKLNVFGEEKYSIRKVPAINLHLLCNTGFPLKRLEIDIGEDILESEFQQVLSSFAKTLEILVIWRGLLAQKIRGFPYGVNLPRLKHLRIPESCLKDMTFVNFMRNLENLTVLQCDLEPIAYTTDLLRNRRELEVGRPRELAPVPSVRLLKIEYTITEADIQFLRRLFPKLIKLSAFVGNHFVTRHYD